MLAYLSSDDAASEPVSLDEAKVQARIDSDLTDDDGFIQATLIPGARQLAETRTGAAIRPARYRQRLT
ncbi:MAG: phage gp6-like head-tail connector protein, partial [Mycolicibacterium aromaticivorans]|nr:phage gp6-like head-tail connector protein [Mycolicibacterium aromaticivorans]